MRAARFSAAALALSSLLAIAWSIGAGGCGGIDYIWECESPDGADLGSANTANDPNNCPCTCCSTGPKNGKQYPQGVDCPGSGMDAGNDAEGGPLPASSVALCSGECWPPPPYGWGSPVLLWSGTVGDAPQCPDGAPYVFYNGYSGDSGDAFALACQGGASGACPVSGEVCAPVPAEGFSRCVVRDDVVPCPILGAPALEDYTEQHVFYEFSGQPVSPSTFCCLPSPSGQG